MGFSATAEALFTAFATTAAAVAVGSALTPGARRPGMPPSPVIPQAQVDQSAQEAENTSRRRQQLAGGLLSTVGTSGGEAGAILNPSTVSGAALLGR